MTSVVIACALTAGAFGAEAIDVVNQDVKTTLDQAVRQASQMRSESGGPLLPAGTIVDRAEWKGSVLHIDLTMPAGDRWDISPLDMEALSKALGRPFTDDPAFGGTALRVRANEDQHYGTLEQFAPSGSVPPPEADDALPDGPIPVQRTAAGGETSATSLGGPTVQGARQPIGALTGVTVFVSAGHGWTAGTSEWFLQRPGDLCDMNEDYGNLDQLDYFAHYAFNAGATVVPFRPAGWQNIEIVLDNDDPGVTFTGSWNDGVSSKYYENNVTVSGIIYKATPASTTETATARYTPDITVTDFYPVYCFTIASSNRTLQTYRIKHSGGISEVTVDHRLVGNGWIWLGEYHLEAGGDNYVEITNESPDSGYVIADAIRWGSGMGDIERASPAKVSGYPRDEECSRYWAHSELGNNAVGFSATAIWDSSTSDQNDNVRTAAHWAKEMNQTDYNNDRWRRIYYEFHTNALNGSARGCIALITDLGATTYQAEYATFMADEIDADLLVLDSEFEHAWYDRSSPTYTGSYGAICTAANGNEFDATIIELAFHDNQTDAELLRDSRVRAAMAKASVQGIIRFLNWMPGSTVPLAFPPDTPRNVQAVDAGNGDVTLTWAAPLSGDAHGDPATGYVIYQSSNGYGFGSPVTVGNVLTHTLSGLPVGETRYYRIAATNAGGESMPSEVLAVRRPANGTAEVLIVSGFDRLRRQQNYVQEFAFPPDYAGLTPERQIWRRSNAFDYAVQQAEALAAAGVGFSSCANEAVIAQSITLGSYPAVTWISGEESTQDETFDDTEQSNVTTYLNAGGNLFVSGAEIGWDLDAQGSSSDQTFYNDSLKADYYLDDADTYDVSPAAGSIFDGIAPFSFDDGTLFYDSEYADVLNTIGGSTAALNYVGGTGGTAGIVFDGTFKVVNLGFPFETITSAASRAEVMDRVIGFFFPGSECTVPADCDDDLFCNGTEDCVDETCVPGSDPCPGQGCDETNDVCVPCDDDGTCELGEDCTTCPNDCISGGGGGGCGNGVCELTLGEDCLSCPSDCRGKQVGATKNQFCCGDGDGTNPVDCTDSRCSEEGFACTDVPPEPYCCGDLTCEGAEDSFNCEVDCGAPPFCGDDTCDAGEDQCNCPDDCGTPPSTETNCTDDVDNDCDTFADCDDGDCDGDPACECLLRGEVCTLDSECCSNWCHRGECK
ncbi:MAG: N-acetylmuramoyl-L-alanine amidase [Phycisphaerales bacterium]|nr:MAG: N-acetylmuramoyl-L-alanine amidase [Phycisphaerales bacterium]